MKIVIRLLLLFCFLKSDAQKFDYNWLAGYDSQVGYDSAFNYWFGISQFDFNYPSVIITRDSLGINFNRTNTIISDSDGNIIFYSNGVRVDNSLGQLMINGDSLGEGYVLNYLYPLPYEIGLPYNQSQIILPNPNQSGKYDIFHSYIDTGTGGVVDLAATKLLRSSIDIHANSDSGLVFPKNVPILNHEINNAICATKHGNGIDWWVCVYQVGTNCFNMVLYDGSDSLLSYTSCSGIGFYHPHQACMNFSPDGTKFAMASDSGYVSFYDFDRCNGIMSFLDSINIPQIIDSDWIPWGLQFSSSSRFVYVFCDYKMFQFDMYANSISSSKQLIATYNPDTGIYFFHPQLAPDGKIYVNSANTDYRIGVIDSPDVEGSGCTYLDGTIKLPTYISGLPYYPNYRLGSLSASACDSLSGLSEATRAEKEMLLKVYPNPTSNLVTIDYGFTNWSVTGAVSLEIADELGQIVYTQQLPQYSGFQKLDVAKYAAGLYTAFIRRNEQVIAAQKFAKE